MQITEVSVLGVRSAVVVLRHRRTPLRSVLVPTVHMGLPEYYRRIAERISRLREALRADPLAGCWPAIWRSATTPSCECRCSTARC